VEASVTECKRAARDVFCWLRTGFISIARPGAVCCAFVCARGAALELYFSEQRAIKMKLVHKKNAFFKCEVIKDLSFVQRTAESVFTVSRSRRKD
jgi:hypothetical protein